MRLKIASFIGAFLLPIFSILAQDLENVEVKSQEVQGKIKMLTGWGGNIGMLDGTDGIVLIDDQMSGLNQKLIAELANISEQSVKFIINTHYHYDHTDGNKALGKEGALIVSHENVRKRLTSDQVIEYFKYNQAAYPPEALPKVTFLDSMTLHLNGETLEVYHFPNAHTDGDAIIYFKESNVVHMGDIFVTYGFPFVDVPNGGKVSGIISACSQIISRTNDETKFIPGHGSISSREDLMNYKNMLAEIHTRVTDQYKSGTLLSEINVEEMVKGYEEIGGRPAADFVMFIYLSLSQE